MEYFLGASVAFGGLFRLSSQDRYDTGTISGITAMEDWYECLLLSSVAVGAQFQRFKGFAPLEDPIQ